MKIVLDTSEFTAIMLKGEERLGREGNHFFIQCNGIRNEVFGEYNEVIAIIDKDSLQMAHQQIYRNAFSELNMYYSNPIENPIKTQKKYFSIFRTQRILKGHLSEDDKRKFLIYETNLLSGFIFVLKKVKKMSGSIIKCFDDSL